MELNFTINKQKLLRIDRERPVNLSQNYLVCKFHFDEDWTGLTKYLLCSDANDTYIQDIGEEQDISDIILPHEALHGDYVNLSLYGVDDTLKERITTNTEKVHLIQSGFTKHISPTKPPSEDFFTKILNTKFDDAHFEDGILSFYANKKLVKTVEISGSGGTSDYESLENKPKINNVELSGNKTDSELDLQHKLTAGENINISDDNVISATGELSIDYETATNKPKINGNELIDDKSSSDLGLQGELTAGENINISEDNVISASGGSESKTYYADEESLELSTDNVFRIKEGYLSNVATSGDYEDLTDKPTIPTKTSELSNDMGYITASYHDPSKQNTLTAGDNITIDDDNVISASGGGEGGIYSADEESLELSTNNVFRIKEGYLADIAISGDYDDLDNKPTIPTKTSELINDSQYITPAYHDYTKQDLLTAGKDINISDDNVISYTGSGGGSDYTAEDDTISIDNTNHTIRGNYEAGDDISIEGNKINYTGGSGGKNYYADNVSLDLDEDNTFSIKEGYLSSVATTGKYSDLSDKPTIPTKTSELENDSGYITEHQSLEEYYKKSETDELLEEKVDKIEGKGLSTVDFTDTNYVHTDNNYTTEEKTKLASLENYDDTEIKSEIEGKTVTLEESEGTSDIAKIYTLYQGSEEVGEINIPKEMIISEGKIIEEDGIKYLELILTNGDVVKINLADLCDAYTADNVTLDLSNENVFSIKEGYLSDVAISGDYEDLSNKPTIPTKTSELTNDSDYITPSYHDTTKQDKLTAKDNTIVIDESDNTICGNYEAGTNISIEDNKISYTGGTGSDYTAEDETIIIDNTNHTIKGGYEAGENITIEGNKINATGDLSLDYEKATNKPKINGNELLGDKSSSDLGLQGELEAGDNITIDENNRISATGDLSLDYEKATNKPQINGIELSGDKTDEELDLQHKLRAGENIDISEDNVISATGGSGTSDYKELSNKPSINGITLQGNLNDTSLNLQHALSFGDHIMISDNCIKAIGIPEKTSDLTNDSKFVTDDEVTTKISTAIAKMEIYDNKVNSITGTGDTVHYPTTRAVVDYINTLNGDEIDY